MEIEKVGLITYHHPHLKTEQVIRKLVKKSYEYKVFALPFVLRKVRKVVCSHRPDQSESVIPETLALRYGLPYIRCGSDEDIDNSCDIYLILGAGILSPKCVVGKKILNCHPGIIPACRGLDSFKWAIYEMKPLGVTLHYIDENVDAGEVISVVTTDVYKSDSVMALARRHYETEIELLADFDVCIKNPSNEFSAIAPGEPRMRMPISEEQKLSALFPAYLEKYGAW